MATETLPSGNFVVDIRRTEGRWRLSLGTAKVREAKQRKAMLMALADSDEGRAILDQLKARALKIDDVERALAPGGKGVASLRPKARGITVAQACESYISHANVRKASLQQIRFTANALKKGFGATTPLAKVTRTQAKLWLHRKEWSPRTQEARYVYAKAIWREAKVHENVWEEVRPQERVEKEIAILSSEEVANFLAQLDTKHRAWMGCGYLAGLRLGEACQLRWSDVDFVDGVLHIRNRGGKKAWVTKSGKIRHVEVPNALMRALEEWQEEKGARGEYVFGMRGGPLARDTGIVWARQAYERAGMVAGRKREGWTYHAGRHSAASNALRAGVAPSIVAAWLGNTVEVLLKTYSHVLQGDTRAVADALKLHR